jgi:hypothetical protein
MVGDRGGCFRLIVERPLGDMRASAARASASSTAAPKSGKVLDGRHDQAIVVGRRTRGLHGICCSKQVDTGAGVAFRA